MSKVSIIAPIYNTEKQLRKCLDSLVNQTYKDIEIIVINDGSPDNSEFIVNEYIAKYGQMIRYYSKENEGIAKTRNFGIEKATSDYVLFVDTDDYIESDLIEKLIPYIDMDIDMIKFKFTRVDENGNTILKSDGPVFETTTGEDAFNKLYCTDVVLDSPCLYLMKKKLFTDNGFKFKRTYHEDYGLIPLVILKSKSFVSTNNYFYYYVQADNDSITRTSDYNRVVTKMKDALGHYDDAIVEIDKMDIDKTTKENAKIYYTNAIILKLRTLQDKDRKIFIKEIKKRKMFKNIKVRDFKQLIKRILLNVNVNLYLKLQQSEN